MTDIVLTIDVDWAPDFAIESVADQLVASAVRATWFVTHSSPAVERLRAFPHLFELGIHPNLMPGSSHGESPDEVLRNCMQLVPEATSMRSHALVQSTHLLWQVMTLTPITTDVSTFLPCTPGLRPAVFSRLGRDLVRVPYFWGDNYEMSQSCPCWSVQRLLAIGQGLKVLAFHPIHVHLNSGSLDYYERFRAEVGGGQAATRTAVDRHHQSGEGTGTLFSKVVEHLASHGGSRLIRELGSAALDG